MGKLILKSRHRLKCGDSTMIDNVDDLMNGEKADMVFTDPPYGMNLNADFSGMKFKFKGSTGGNKYDNVIGDHDDFSEDLINIIFTLESVKEVFIWGADYFAEIIPERNKGSWVVWDKRGDESADKMFGSTFELCWSKIKHKRETARIRSGIFGVKDDSKKRVHPTQKPVQLAEWFFDNWCKDLNLCVDLYLGSGSTLIACEKTNRKCYGMELDRKYCDVIIKRYMEYTKRDDIILESTGQKYTEITATHK